MIEVWEDDWMDFKRRLRTDKDALLTFEDHAPNPSLDMSEAAVQSRRQYDPAREPAGEHTHGGGCDMCKAAREAAKARRAPSPGTA